MSSDTQMLGLTIECTSCNGTGLYIGMAEKDGAAVICFKCKGSGQVNFTYRPFTGRKQRDDVVRVFKGSFGFMHYASNVMQDDGFVLAFASAGCTYEEWLNGVEPKPMKELYCPYLWTDQHLQTDDVNDLYRNCCSEGLPAGNYIFNCKHFSKKQWCWATFETKMLTEDEEE